MNQSPTKHFTCPHCHKRFQWTTQIADRKAQCPSCHRRIRIPTVPGRVAEAIDPLPESKLSKPVKDDSGTYDLDLTGIDESVVEPPPSPAQQAAAQTGRCPACNQAINPGAVICIKCGYNLKKGKRLQTAVAEGGNIPPAMVLPDSLANSALASISGISAVAQALEDREDDTQSNRFINLWLPVAMIVLGLSITLLSGWYFKDVSAIKIDWRIQTAISIALQIIVMAPLLLFAATVTVRLLNTSFGPLYNGVFKLIAIAMGPLALADALVVLLVPAAYAFSLTWVLGIYITIYVIFCAPVLYVLFDLDYVEVMLTTTVIIILRLGVSIGLLAVILSLFQ